MASDERRATCRRYYEKNKKRILAKQRAYQAENKERRRISSQNYYEKNKEKINRYNRAYYETNKSRFRDLWRLYRQTDKSNGHKIRDRGRRFIARNRQSRIEYSRRYRSNHPDEVRYANRAYYTKNRDLLIAKQVASSRSKRLLTKAVSLASQMKQLFNKDSTAMTKTKTKTDLNRYIARWDRIILNLREADGELTAFSVELRGWFPKGDVEALAKGDEEFKAWCADNLDGITVKEAACLLVRAICAPILDTAGTIRVAAGGRSRHEWRSIETQLQFFRREEQEKVADHSWKHKVSVAQAVKDLGLRVVSSPRIARNPSDVAVGESDAKSFAEYILSTVPLEQIPAELRQKMERYVPVGSRRAA